MQIHLGLLGGIALFFAVAQPAAARIYWGDVHAHSNASDDAVGTPEEFFLRARDVVGLDFVVLSDHDIYLTPEEWEQTNQTLSAFDEPGRFVTLSGIEWSHGWHMNLYFEHDGENLCSSPTSCRLDGDFAALRRAYGPRVANGEAAAHINHPSARTPVNWVGIDDTFTTNVEMWNALWDTNLFGSPQDLVEYSLGGPIWALQAGYRLGFVAASDDHYIGRPFSRLGKALTACDADKLNRKQILKALRERRCYATNGERIQVHLNVNGVPMGRELSVPLNSEVTVKLRVTGTEVPSLMEVLRNGEVVARKADCSSVSCSFSTRVSVLEEHTFIYARVHQSRGRRAWATPIWIRGLCVRPEDCPVTRFAGASGDPATSCYAAWRLLPGPDRDRKGGRTNHISCTDGDNRCDFGIDEKACDFRVGVCVGIQDDNSRSCRLGPLESMRVASKSREPTGVLEEWNDYQLQAALNALGPNPAPGACTPYINVRVPAGNGTDRPGRRELVLRTRSNGAVDQDSLVLRCRQD